MKIITYYLNLKNFAGRLKDRIVSYKIRDRIGLYKTSGSYEETWFLLPTITYSKGKQRFIGYKSVYIHFLRFYIKITWGNSTLKDISNRPKKF